MAANESSPWQRREVGDIFRHTLQYHLWSLADRSACRRVCRTWNESIFLRLTLEPEVLEDEEVCERIRPILLKTSHLTCERLSEEATEGLSRCCRDLPHLEKMQLWLEGGATATIETLLDPERILPRLRLLQIGGDLDAPLKFQHLISNHSIRKLNFSASRFGDEAAAHLLRALIGGNRSLTALNLGSRRLSSELDPLLAELLERSSSLKRLDLRSNRVLHVGMARFCAALEQNSTLKALDLSLNNLPDLKPVFLSQRAKQKLGLSKLVLLANDFPHSDFAALVDSLSSNQSLTNLQIWVSSPDSEGGKELATIFEANQTLRKVVVAIPRAQYLGAMFSGLRRNFSVTHLQMNSVDCDSFAENCGAFLRSTRVLRSFILTTSDLHRNGGAIVRAIAENTSVSRLDLSRTKLGNDPTAGEALRDMLTRNQTLRYLVLLDCNMTGEATDLMLDGAKKNSVLTTLYYARNEIGPSSVSLLDEIARNHPTIDYIDFQDAMIQISDATSLAHAIKANPRITTFAVSVEVGPESGQRFPYSTNLASDVVQYAPWPAESERSPFPNYSSTTVQFAT